MVSTIYAYATDRDDNMTLAVGLYTGNGAAGSVALFADAELCTRFMLAWVADGANRRAFACPSAVRAGVDIPADLMPADTRNF